MKALLIALVLVFTVSIASAQSNKTTQDGKKECKKECVDKKACKKECCKDKKDGKCCKDAKCKDAKKGECCKDAKKGECQKGEKKCCKKVEKK